MPQLTTDQVARIERARRNAKALGVLYLLVGFMWLAMPSIDNDEPVGLWVAAFLTSIVIGAGLHGLQRWAYVLALAEAIIGLVAGLPLMRITSSWVGVAVLLGSILKLFILTTSREAFSREFETATVESEGQPLLTPVPTTRWRELIFALASVAVCGLFTAVTLTSLDSLGFMNRRNEQRLGAITAGVALLLTCGANVWFWCRKKRHGEAR